MFEKIRTALQSFITDHLANQRESLANQREIVGQLKTLNTAVQALTAERNEQLERIAGAVESLTEMKRGVLHQSHPHLVR